MKMDKLESSFSSATRLKDLDRRESNTSVPMSQRNGSTNGVAYPVSSRRRASMFDPIDPTELQKTLYQTKSNVYISLIFLFINYFVKVFNIS